MAINLHFGEKKKGGNMLHTIHGKMLKDISAYSILHNISKMNNPFSSLCYQWPPGSHFSCFTFMHDKLINAFSIVTWGWIGVGHHSQHVCCCRL